MEKIRKNRKKREAIAELLRQTKEHPGADRIFTQLRGAHPDLSLATVYRNLAMFREEGAVARVCTVNGQDRFDWDTSLHAHFVCDCCLAVIDIPSQQEFSRSYGIIESELGHVVQEHSLIYRGKCKECINKEA